jgi:16S rRNA (guanine527-N7)-methyltransferase
MKDEEEARAWIAAHFDVPRETWAALDRFVTFLREEALHQNLVAASTLEHVWRRHIADSAQLLRHAPDDARNWADLGAGAGFPGLIVAVLSDKRVTLIESRRKRIEFLGRAAEELGVGGRVEILGARVESVIDRRFDIISARAFAPLERLLAIGTHLATNRTTWLLPKGQSAAEELDAARGTWQGAFRIEPSVTDPQAGIIVARDVRPRNSR